MRSALSPVPGAFSAASPWTGMVLALLFVAVQGFDILTYPLVNYDMVFLNDAGLQLVRTGQFRADVLSQNPGFESRYLWQPPGLALSSALSYGVFGFGIWQTRLASILFGAAGVWVTFELVRRLRPHGPAALIAALTLFFWPQWVLTAKDSRMDTAAIFALLMATYLVLRAVDLDDRSRRGPIFVAGLFASVAGIFHSAGVTWALGLLIVIAIFFRERVRLAFFFCVGAGLLVGLWLLYALQFPGDFERQYLALLLDRTGKAGIASRLRDDMLLYAHRFSRIPTIYPVLLIAAYGIVAQALWKDRRVRLLLVLTGLVIALNAIVVGGRTGGFYFLYPLALVFCVAAIGLGAFLKPAHQAAHLAPRRRGWAMAATTVCIAAFVLNLATLSVGPRLLAFWFQGEQRDYGKQMASFSSRLKPGDQIWGSAPVWFAAVRAGARLNALEPVPPFTMTRPDPARHKYVVVDRGTPFDGSEDYKKVEEFGTDLPPVMGRSLSDKPYKFDLWQSRRID
jgi:4-amino-4-deoxy-L-arabinose transferase-like glycosyltransferase